MWALIELTDTLAKMKQQPQQSTCRSAMPVWRWAALSLLSRWLPTTTISPDFLHIKQRRLKTSLDLSERLASSIIIGTHEAPSLECPPSQKPPRSSPYDAGRPNAFDGMSPRDLPFHLHKAVQRSVPQPDQQEKKQNDVFIPSATKHGISSCTTFRQLHRMCDHYTSD